MDSVRVNFDRIAKEFRFKLDASHAIITVGTIESDTNVISGLVAAAEVAAECEFIFENTDVLSPGNRERFESFHEEARICLKLFKDKYKITLLATTPEKHTIEVPAGKGNGRTIRHIAPSQAFAEKAKAHTRHFLTDAQWAEVDELLKSRDFGDKSMWAAFTKIGEAYGVSRSTIWRRYQTLTK